MAQSLLTVTPQGLHCPAGDFFIDPWGPVSTAVITHAHSDHARVGSGRYIATPDSAKVLKKRLGPEIQLHLLTYGERLRLNDVTISLHPAGHILGSAQIRVEHHGEVWVVTGDYKRQADSTCLPFEVVPCDTLITEATFGLPIYKWDPTEEVVAEIFAWWMEQRAKGKNALLACYALGKAQRILAELQRFTNEPVLVHGAIDSLIEVYRDAGVALVPTQKVGATPLQGALVLAPPSAFQSPWAKRFGDASHGFASGWMRLRGTRRNRGYDRGFVISDHADWDALLSTVEATGAKRILVTHGYAEELSRYLRDQGLDARALKTLYEGEGDA